MGKDINVAEREIEVAVKVKKADNNTWIITPEFTAGAGKAPPKNFIFIIDCSGSMGGRRLDLVKAAIRPLLDKLDIGDQLSIITFNDQAQCLIQNQIITPDQNADYAKNQIGLMSASGGTSFAPAFREIKARNLVSPTHASTIIFLSDGEGDDISSSAAPANIIKLITLGSKRPLLIPIAIDASGTSTTYLTSLTQQANPHIQPIFINNEAMTNYIRAFEQAFNLAIEHSQQKTRLEVVIEANDNIRKTRLESKRELSQPVHYDNKTPNTYSFVFESPVPPTSCRVRFICDGIHLAFDHQFQPKELPTDSGVVNQVRINKVQWKDNTALSWLKCLSKVVFGLGIIGACVAFGLMFTPASLAALIGVSFLAKMTGITWALTGLGSIPGLLLLGSGLTDLTHKTISWKTKTTGPANNCASTQGALKHFGGPSTVPTNGRKKQSAPGFYGQNNEQHPQPRATATSKPTQSILSGAAYKRH
jgi:uncharacterized protein YegL